MIIDPDSLPMPESGHEEWLMTLDLRHPQRALKDLPIDFLLKGSVYYPASHFDGRPVQYLGRRIQSFVYVDYLVSRSQLMAELADPDRNFKGYRLAAHRPVEPKELSGNHPWNGQPAPCLQTEELLPRIREMWSGPPRDERGFARPNESFCEWMIFERKPDFGPEHGPKRFSILHLHADGVASYQALYWTRGIAPTVLCLIQPGMNWDEFRRADGCLATLVLRGGGPIPPFLICGGIGAFYDTAFWPEDYPTCIGYFKFENGNGLWAHKGWMSGATASTEGPAQERDESGADLRKPAQSSRPQALLRGGGDAVEGNDAGVPSAEELFFDSISANPNAVALIARLIDLCVELQAEIHHTHTNGGDLRIRCHRPEPRHGRQNIWTMHWQPKRGRFACETFQPLHECADLVDDKKQASIGRPLPTLIKVVPGVDDEACLRIVRDSIRRFREQ